MEVELYLMALKRHCQLVHMCIKYNFIGNLHITETHSILRMSKSTRKQVFQSMIENQAKHLQDCNRLLDVL